MTLFKLKEELEWLLIHKKRIEHQLNVLTNKIGGKGIDTSKLLVDSSNLFFESDTVNEIMELRKSLHTINLEIEIVNRSVDESYELFKRYNDRDKQIYIEKYFYKWSNAKISVKHEGISKSQINRIVGNIKTK